MSIDAIRARLLPKFIVSATARIAKAQAAVVEGKPAVIRDEMHAITGDASMIGQPAIAEAARTASGHAKAWEAGDAAARATCEAALAVLSDRLAALAAPG